MFSATNESTNTAKTTDLSETAISAAPFDVCQLSPIQQLFLCDQAAKYINLSFRLNFARYMYEECVSHFIKWPKFRWFRCPPLISMSADEESVYNATIFIYLSGTREPAKALVFTYNLGNYPGVHASAWMESIDLDILKKVEEAPSEFGLGNVATLISNSSKSETSY